MRRTVALGVAALLVVALGGCSSSQDDTGTGVTTPAGDTGSTGPDATSSTDGGTVTTLGAPPPPGSIPVIEITASSGADGTSPEGSGCTPGTAPSLPDGIWFGSLETIDPAAGTLGLDLACLFFNAAANAAASADGASEVPVPDDVYVRNQNPTVHTEHVVSDVAVALLQNGGGSASFEPTTSGLGAVAPIVGRAVWIEVVDGWVVAIQQQYFP